MEYIELIIGIVIIAFFIRHLVILSKRSGFANSLFRIDTVFGILIGLLLVGTSIHSLIF